MEASEEEIRERCDRLAVDIYDKVGRCHICNVSHDYGHEVDCPANLHHNVRSLLDRLQAAEERVERMRLALQKIRFWSSPENDEATEGDTVAKMWYAAREAMREEADR